MNYSKQRQLILKIVKENSVHPTADFVYEMARKFEPSISLATVYRNLKLLSKTGDIDTLETEDKRLHYDGNTNLHGHFICKRCKEIFDLGEDNHFPKSLQEKGYLLQESKCVYYGLCPKCK